MRRSFLCQDVIVGVLRVAVEIYQINDRSHWALELVYDDGASSIWFGFFPTEQQAWQAFAARAVSPGLAAMLIPPTPYARSYH